ncbi:MAG: ABC transporter ATP-binding protein [Dehalococcoidales bacterium]|nr:ABC transporter ATP-binding protein [Dehalococcoidales bacterium]
METILVLDRVSKRFGGLQAVDDVFLEVNAGQILGIIGPNGAGKSTLFNIICGIYHPDKGRISFKEKFIKKLMPHQICRMGIGRTFQISEVFESLTALESVTLAASLHLPLKEARRQAYTILDQFGLADKAELRCESLTPVDIKLIELSKALATSPEVILLDEVMTSLSRVEAEPLLNIIKNLPHEGITPIIVEHSMHIIQDCCQRVIVLNFGRLIADGTSDEVLSDRTVIDSYLGVKPTCL